MEKKGEWKKRNGRFLHIQFPLFTAAAAAAAGFEQHEKLIQSRPSPEWTALFSSSGHSQEQPELSYTFRLFRVVCVCVCLC